MIKEEIKIKELANIWKHFKLDGYINISRNSSKDLNYTPLGDELSFSENINTDVTINLIKDLKKITLKTNDLSYNDIKRKIEENIDLLKISTPDKDIYLPQIKDIIKTDETQFDINIIDSKFLLKQWDIVKNFSYKKNVSVEGFGFILEETEKIFINSFGSYKTHKKTSCSYGLALYYNSKTHSDIDEEVKNCSNKESVSINFIENLQNKVLKKSDPKKTSLSSGKYNITFKNKLAGEFLGILSHNFIGENINQKQSIFVAEDINKKILDPKLTIVSNPTIKNSSFNQKFDNEGFPSKKLIVVEKGIFKNLFLDSKNAKKLNLDTTGNPNYSNLEILGNFEKNYLKNSYFLFTDLMGLHNIDMITGKFALEGEGFEIKSGKIGKFIKNVSISGDIKSLFSNIETMGDDIYSYSNVFVPSITFKNQNIVV